MTRRLPSPALLQSLTADRDLLHLYIDGRDPAAFTALARRYGPLARRAAADVCPAVADDVAQATLELLGRKAKAVAARASAAGWVFETARRLALKARTAAARRAKHEARATPPAPPPDPLDALSFREVRAAVAEEVARLPDEVRVPLVLCYWAGESQPAAASRLGCSLSTLKRRLDVGRDRLAGRLARRGFAGSAVLATLAAMEAPSVAESAVRRTGFPTCPTVRQDRLGNLSYRPSKPALLGLAATVVLAAGLALGLAPAGDPSPPPSPKPAEAAKAPGPAVDALGDPLPPGAVARLGSVRFRTAAIPRQLAVSPDGKRIVSTASSPGTRLAVWDADTGRLIREVEPPDCAWPEAVCWSADGRGLAACNVGRKDYVVWEFTDPDSKPPVGDGTAPGPESFTACAFTADGTLIAGGERAGPQGPAGKLQLWPVHPGRSVREAPPRFTIEEPAGFVALRFTSDGKRLIGITRAREPDRVKPAAPGFPPRAGPGAMADTARVLVWEVATGRKLVAFDVPARGWEGRSIPPPAVPHAVSPDGKILFTAAWGGRVKAFDLATGKERFDALAFGRPDEPIKESLRRCWSSQVTDLTVTPDGKVVIAAQSTTERTVGLDAATGKERWRRRQDIGFVYATDSNYGLAVFPDGKRFALGHAAERIGVYDAATGRPLVEPDANRDGMAVIGIAPDGKSAITAGRDNVLCRWDLGNGRQLGRVEAGDGVQVAAFAPDGRRAVGARGLLDPATGKRAASLDLQLGTNGANRVAWAPDGSVVAAEIENRAARYAADGKKIADYMVAVPGEPGTGPRVEGVATAPDGKVVVLAGEGATGSENGWVAVFDTVTGAKTRELKGTGGFTSAAFLPDGSRVVLGRWVSGPSLLANHQNTVQGLMTAVVLFDPATGEQATPFDAPDRVAEYRIVRSVAVSPTGAQVAAVEWDKSVTVYETASGGVRQRLRGHRGAVAQAAFTPDGSRLVTVSDDGTGLVWDVTPPRPAGPVALSDAERLKRWATLLSSDAEAAHRAMGELAADPAGAVAFLKAHLKPTAAPTDADLDRLVAGLGASAFADREAAARDLDVFGGLAVAKVRAKVPAVTSAEVRQRLDEFLKRHDRPGRTTGARLREIRAVELLEVIGTPEARAVLAAVARGDSALATDASIAAKRLMR